MLRRRTAQSQNSVQNMKEIFINVILFFGAAEFICAKNLVAQLKLLHNQQKKARTRALSHLAPLGAIAGNTSGRARFGRSARPAYCFKTSGFGESGPALNFQALY